MLIALVALVIVLAAAYLAYDALAAGGSQATSPELGGAAQGAQAAAADADSKASAATGTGTSSPAQAEAEASFPAAEGAGQSADSPATGATDATPATKGPMLADYDVTVYTEFGDARTLTQIANGKPLVMNFWATWCPYCVQEMDDYQHIYDDYADRVSFAFIDCADGQRETVDDGARWLFDNEYTLPAFYDTTQQAQYAFGASALPTTVVVSAEGEILTVSAGAIDADLMRSALDSLLGA